MDCDVERVLGFWGENYYDFFSAGLDFLFSMDLDFPGDLDDLGLNFFTSGDLDDLDLCFFTSEEELNFSFSTSKFSEF